MKEILEEREKITQKEARERVNMVLQEISVMGANNSEFFEISQILKNLEEGNIDPEQAVQEAEQIKSSKQDYH